MDARVSQNEIPSVYDSMSKFYDIWGRLAETRARNRALELAKIIDGQKILEVAVGTGLTFYEIVKRNPNGSNTGIDISQGMLKKAEKRLLPLSVANYQLKIGNAFNLEEESEHFDLLVNSYMFDLIAFDEMDAVLREFRRVLKKEGRMILVNMTKGESFGSRIYSLIYRVSPKAFGGCRPVNLSDKLQQNGFEIKTREYCQQLLFPSEVILALKK
ncbi:MAG: methyltransferase domain-containing protein [Desulfobacterales bacterium]|nr:MAG: methyltransferase domain-containing protein [Desulfobacterales bacterium]